MRSISVHINESSTDCKCPVQIVNFICFSVNQGVLRFIAEKYLYHKISAPSRHGSTLFLYLYII